MTAATQSSLDGIWPKVLCDVRTISWAMSNLGVERIDLLKIDVEGAEMVSQDLYSCNFSPAS